MSILYEIRICEIYYTLSFDDTNCVLVKTKNNKCKPFIRNMEYIFDNQDMARSAGRNWEHDQRKRKNK